MKVSNPDQASFAASFFQTPKADKADRSVTNDVSGLDHTDPSGFSKLLGVGHTDPAAKVSPIARKGLQSSRAAAADRADRVAQSAPKDAPSTPQSAPAAPGAATSAASQKTQKDALHSDQLPSDPRLQDPTELALEAAAAAAIAALTQGAPAASEVVPVVPETLSSLPGDPVTSTAPTGTLNDAAVLAFQNAFRAGLASVTGSNLNATPGNNVQPAVAGQPGDAPVQAETNAQTPAQPTNEPAASLLPQFLPSADQGSVTIQVSPLLLDAVAKQSRAQFAAEQNQTALQALNGTVPQGNEVQSSLLAAQGALTAPVQTPVPLEASVATLARLVVPVVKEVPRASVPLTPAQVSVSTAALSNSQVQSAVASQPVQSSTNAVSPLVQEQAQPLTNAVGEFFAAAQEAARNAPKADASNLGALGTAYASSVSSQPQVSAVVTAQSQTSGDQTQNGNSSNSQGHSNAQTAQSLPQNAAPASNSAPDHSALAPETKHGTLGANSGVVTKENTAPQEPSTLETTLVSSGETASRAVDNSLSDAPVAVPVHVHTSEVESKPTVLPPVQVKAGEVWKTVQDAVQRARSENPNHLSVEVRLEDGSTLGVELRMSSAGLQASFRSESQTLLKSIETQWNGFVTKESADFKVVNAAFEGTSNFGSGNFSENGTSGGDRRQQMENNAASASLSRDFRAPASPSATEGSAVTQSAVPVQSAVESLYA